MTQNNQKPKIMVQNISCVLPQQSNLGALFLGNVYGAQNPTILKEYGIRAVLTSSIQTDINYSFKDVPFHMKIQAHDKQNYNLKEHINKCIDFIEKARQLTNVYVHCYAGVSRSAAIVCAYIMWKLKWNYETTIAFVKAKRIVAKPNQGFVRQLMEIQQAILEQSSYLPSQSSQLEKSSSYLNAQVNTNEIASKYAPQIQNNNDRLQNAPKPTIQQKTLQQRASSNKNNHYVQNVPQNNAQHNSSMDHSKHTSQTCPVQKDVYFPDKYYNPNQSLNSLNHQPYQTVQPIVQKTQKNDRFLYLQNFFPQNHTAKRTSQYDSKTPQNNSKGNQNDLKARSNLSLTSTGQNWINHQNDLQFSPISSQGFKKIQNSHGSSAKSLVSYQSQQSQKPVSSNSQLTLGGKKPTYNHNSIPVPKVSERKQHQKNNNNLARVSESIPQTNNLYRTQAQTTQHIHRTSHGIEMMPKVNEYMWTTPTQQKFSMQNKLSNERMKSPVNDNIYNKKFDFRSSAPSQGFYNNKSTSQQKQAQKTTSRLLVRPKDLPGYKNY